MTDEQERIIAVRARLCAMGTATALSDAEAVLVKDSVRSSMDAADVASLIRQARLATQAPRS